MAGDQGHWGTFWGVRQWILNIVPFYDGSIFFDAPLFVCFIDYIYTFQAYYNYYICTLPSLIDDTLR